MKQCEMCDFFKSYRKNPAEAKHWHKFGECTLTHKTVNEKQGQCHLAQSVALRWVNTEERSPSNVLAWQINKT